MKLEIEVMQLRVETSMLREDETKTSKKWAPETIINWE